MRGISVGVLVMLVMSACAYANTSPRPSSSPSTTAAPTVATAIACAGVGIGPIRIHISADGSSTADLLDKYNGYAVVGTVDVVWPHGYSAHREGSGPSVIVNAIGETVAVEGTTLTDMGTCRAFGGVPPKPLYVEGPIPPLRQYPVSTASFGSGRTAQ